MSNNESVKNPARIKTLVEKLRGKLKNFQVMDREGQLIGEVNDLILDDNLQINLVISQLATEGNPRLFLLMSKLVQKIDPPTKSVLVALNKEETDRLPEYVMTETPGMELSKMPNSPLTPTDEAVAYEATTVQKQPGDYIAIESSDQEVLEEEMIRLLGERVVVERSKRKVGEVIVRKEIETRMVQVPVRRERLIVEQVSPERKQLAEIDLGQEEVTGIYLTEGELAAIDMPENINPDPKTASLDNQLTVRGEFNSPKIASLLLNAIALERRHGCKKVRVEIVVEDAERQKTYQQWVDRCADSQQRTSE